MDSKGPLSVASSANRKLGKAPATDGQPHPQRYQMAVAGKISFCKTKIFMIKEKITGQATLVYAEFYMPTAILHGQEP